MLCELEIPYLQKTAARGSPKRQELVDTYGQFQVCVCVSLGTPAEPLPHLCFHTSPRQVVCRFLKTPTPVPHLCFHTYFECLQVPFLEDPNTGVCMFESKAIIEYLEKTYGGGAAQ